MAEIKENNELPVVHSTNLLKQKKITWKKIWSQRELILMSFPFLILCIIFAYVPLWGWLMAFQNYDPTSNILHQTWVGVDNFTALFLTGNFMMVLRNTLAMSVINLILQFSTTIILALLLNEVKLMFFKRTVQTISYLPHFLSWVIAAGIVQTSLSPTDGIVNIVLMNLHLISRPVAWLGVGDYFWGIIGVAGVWKEVGWGTIIYLATMSGIDPSLYEAAEIDGANRYRKMWNITLPGIKPTIIILLIMNVGHILDAGFEAQYLLQNSATYDWAQTIDIYVLKWGIQMSNYSLATAAGIFKSVVSIVLLFIANFIAKRLGQERLI